VTDFRALAATELNANAEAILTQLHASWLNRGWVNRKAREPRRRRTAQTPPSEHDHGGAERPRQTSNSRSKTNRTKARRRPRRQVAEEGEEVKRNDARNELRIVLARRAHVTGGMSLLALADLAAKELEQPCNCRRSDKRTKPELKHLERAA
jgi:hypothetical protein